jgi:hypothetical protein
MVLGVSFLRTLGPILWDFNDLCMAFTRQDRRVFWRGIGSTRHDIRSTRCINAIRHNEQELLDTLLQSFEDVFAVLVGLPPARPCDHRIHLLPPRWLYTHTDIYSCRRTNWKLSVLPCSNRA